MVQRLARSRFKPESDPSNTALSCRISDLQRIQEVTADARRCPSRAIGVQFAPKSKRLGTSPSPWLYAFVIRPRSSLLRLCRLRLPNAFLDGSNMGTMRA